MGKLSRKKIKQFFADADAAAKKADKGKCLEDLACHLFESVPGFSISARNKKNAYDTQEIDIALWNDQHPKGFKALNFLILVECKNWDKPVGSMEVNWFITKIRDRALDFGILIAANGITGSEVDKKNAHDVASKALKDGIRLVVITRAEIEDLQNAGQLVALIKQKLLELTVAGTVWG